VSADELNAAELQRLRDGRSIGETYGPGKFSRGGRVAHPAKADPRKPRPGMSKSGLKLVQYPKR
jgi:hypothetical protein